MQVGNESVLNEWWGKRYTNKWMNNTNEWCNYFFLIARRQFEDEKFIARYTENMKPIH